MASSDALHATTLLPQIRASSVSDVSHASHASDLSAGEENAIASLPTDEERAAAKIQALARGQLVRKQQKDQQLWQAWNELDWKEEAELMASHQQYEELKADLKRKKSVPDRSGQAAAAAATSASAAAGAPVTAATNVDSGVTLPPISSASPIAAPASPSTAAPASPRITLTPRPPASSSSAAAAAAAAATAGTPSPPASPRTYLIRTKTVLPKQASLEKRKPPAPVEDDGLTLSDPIQLDFVTAMMDHFKFNKMLDLPNVVELLRRVKAVLKAQPNVVHINVSTRLTVVGDLHGQLDDLLAIFKLNGLPSPRNAYIFNGDFVDRGQFSCECVLTLFAFKLLYPNSVHCNRGNHEARDINSRDGFEKEVTNKYNYAVFDLFSDVFACIPLAAVINREIFVTHGGLANEDFTIEQLQQVDRFHEIPPSDSLMEDLLWSDPDRRAGRRDSPRGAGISFGPEVTAAFLAQNSLRLVIRSHECVQKGYEMHHDDTLLTVFSASNYCGVTNNEAAFIIFERDLIPRIVPFYAKPKERLSRYRMRHAVMQNDVIAKLLQRIADNRLALTNYYRTVEAVTTSGVHTVTRAQWAEGLKTVLQLNIPFLEFQDYLGLPKLGVDGRKKGDVDYQTFLLRFRPINALLDPNKHGPGSRPASPGPNGAPGTSPPNRSRSINENVDAILEMLQKNRYELESLFRHFDLNGDESISVSEFKEGISSLQSLLGFEFSDADMDRLIAHIDTNSDGEISYAEFFSGFQIADPTFGAIQRQHSALRTSAGRNKSGSEVPPAETPSPVITPRRLEEQKQLKEEP